MPLLYQAKKKNRLEDKVAQMQKNGIDRLCELTLAQHAALLDPMIGPMWSDIEPFGIFRND